jgi:aryl-alcohol dehydrogenase-like predicted oxidoreductase|tara:strand:+ start:7709 stop:8746 length:1038 start_codon:yes stop_codon:yes gene_type:complete
MNYKKLGNTNIDVSTICLGTMTWGEQNTQIEGFEQMYYALEKGVNFWDTAELYAIPPKKNTYGKTEEVIGNWFEKSKKRSEVILATKVAGPGLSWIRGGGNQYDEKNLNEAVNESLKRLKTDYIDLYQLHWPERKSNFFGRLGYQHKDENDWNKFEDILNSLDKIVQSGKVRYVGLSNETAWGLSKFLEISKLKKLPRMMSVQNPYSLLNRTYEVGLAEVSVREESGLLAYSPLAFGYLTGKYRNGELPKNSRMKLFGDQFHRYKTQNGQLAIEEYYKIANKYDLDFAQMSIKFLEIQPFVTSVIIGATTMEQLKINIESVNVNLSDDVIKEINEIQKIYPNPCP